MSVRVDKVVLDEHLEKGVRPQPCNNLVQAMLVVFEVSDGNSLGKGLHKDRRVRVFFKRDREPDVISIFEHLVKNKEVFFLYGKIYLLDESPFHGLFVDGNVKCLRKYAQKSAHEKQQVDISLDVLFDPWVSNFYGNFFALIFCLVYLAY